MADSVSFAALRTPLEPLCRERGPQVKDRATMAEGNNKTGDAAPRALPPEAQRALEEAALRRREKDASEAARAKVKEIGGPKGPEPTRYGDWEKKGITSDF
jgi:hypothetical protein